VAGSDTGQLTVSVVVQGGCSLNGGQLDFGQYVPGQATDLNAIGTIGFVNCGGDLTFALDGGAGGSVDAREMRSGDSRLSYQIYRNPSRTAVWGDGAEAREVTLLSPFSGSLEVYGRIPSGQVVSPGVYTDVINVTLSF
jgi:spore coat protein U-like protein